MKGNNENFEFSIDEFIAYNENCKLEDELIKKTKLYYTLFNNHCSVMLVINADTGNIIEANEAASAYYGYSKEQISSMNINDFNMLGDEEIKNEMALALNQSRNFFKFKHRLANNSIKDVEVHSFPVKSNNDNVLLSIVYDVEEKIKQKLMFDQLLIASPYAVAILDKDQRIVNLNENFTKMFQYELDEVKGEYLYELVYPYDKKVQIEKNVEMIYHGQIVKQEGKRRRKDGELIDIELIGYPVLYHQDIIGVYIIYIDMSHKLRDALTGLYNRNHFVETIDTLILNYSATNEMFSIIVIDIVEFKDINDTLGHILGDKFLIEITKRLKSVIGEKHLISRIDGDEFAVLTLSTNKKELFSLAELILDNLNKPYKVSNTEIYLNFNVGISTFPKDGINSENLIRFSNVAMHEADDRISFYNNEISEKIEQKFFLANYLFSAIVNNELYIRYQPIFNIIDKNIVSAEALLRWENNVLGEVTPSNFIPIAEKTGLIISIGDWVIRRVCEQISYWKEKQYKLIPISINISVKQLENVDFANSIIEILNNYNIDPQLIEFEITESVSSGDITKIVSNIQEIKKHGVKISMDDFGTGFSSLGQLDVFELDKLKIDKIFIDDIVTGIKRQNLVKSIIAMAQSLNLVTVAEGIETKEQLCHLKGLGCNLGQGFVFSKPLRVEEIEKFLKGDKLEG